MTKSRSSASSSIALSIFVMLSMVNNNPPFINVILLAKLHPMITMLPLQKCKHNCNKRLLLILLCYMWFIFLHYNSHFDSFQVLVLNLELLTLLSIFWCSIVSNILLRIVNPKKGLEKFFAVFQGYKHCCIIIFF